MKLKEKHFSDICGGKYRQKTYFGHAGVRRVIECTQACLL